MAKFNAGKAMAEKFGSMKPDMPPAETEAPAVDMEQISGRVAALDDTQKTDLIMKLAEMVEAADLESALAETEGGEEAAPPTGEGMA